MKGKLTGWLRRQLREAVEVAAATLAGFLAFVLVYAALMTAMGITGAGAETMWVAVSDGSHLNGRSWPVDGRIEAKLLRGWEVDVQDQRDGWARVAGYGESGSCWVDARYLTRSKPGEVRSCEATPMRVTVDKLRVRSCPGGDVVKRLRKGAVVLVTGYMEQGGERWARIDGGYVMARYLEAEE